MTHKFLVGLLSLFVVSASACAQTTRPAGPTKPVNLLAGAKWVCSADDGKAFSAESPSIKAETTTNITARTEFNVADTAGLVVLELTPNLPTRSQHYLKFFLNGEQIIPPMEGMNYKTIPAIDAKMLRKGRNTLTAKITLKNLSSRRRKAEDYQLDIDMRLAALKAEHLQLQTGPILGAIGKDYFTLTCRTNMPADVKLIMDGVPKAKIMSHQQTSELGLRHRFRVKMPNLRPDEKWAYHISANRGEQTVATKRWPVMFVPTNKALRFVAMGDSRTNSKDWAKVAGAVLKVKPDLIVFSGDMVAYGLNDWEWDEQFFGPAKELFATIPFYAVIGNHEKNAPLYNELFYTPGKDGRNRNFSQEINGVLLIGIDGEQDFSAGGENYEWLEKTLAGSKAKFIFFFTHYPAWTSSNHGWLNKDTGRPGEKAVRQAQDVIAPLLTKYKAIAYICGHDHVYERSELPGGLTHIIAGGAGAPLRKKVENAEKQNPHSKVFASVLHYCLFEVEGDTCTMKTFTPDGKVIDTRTWKARD
ncbi:MAG: metallophosphoesterase [Phycisphaerae bacterium]|nr:metallophosphoesterase [Phycisphaerae bacterium]